MAWTIRALAAFFAVIALPSFEISWETAKHFCLEWMRDQWAKLWTSAPTARVVARFMPRPVKDDAWRKLDRRDQAAVFGLRTGHADIGAHLHKIDPRRNPKCRHCGGPTESPMHLLRDCPLLGEARARLLPRRPTLENCLYGDLRQLRQTAAFFRLATRGEST